MVMAMLLAKETSPAAVNDVGRLAVMAVSEILNTDDPVSFTLKMLPILPLVPIFKESKSPVAVVADPGDQSMAVRLPEERAVEVEETFNPVPDVRALAAIFKAVPVVTEFPLKEKAEVVPVPETTEEVKL